VIVHLFDHGEVAEHYAAQLGNDTLELVTYGSLYFSELWEPGAQH
jgi:hypothetical protein